MLSFVAQRVLKGVIVLFAIVVLNSSPALPTRSTSQNT